VVFKRGREPEAVKDALQGGKTVDEENLAGQDPEAIANDNHEQEGATEEVKPMHDVVTWSNVCYDVDVKGEKRRLLDNVNGYVKPGALTALMGESGAGKTTLLNVLAQRVSTGVITGDFMVNGKPLPKSFQRQTAYCQQEDTHLSTATGTCKDFAWHSTSHLHLVQSERPFNLALSCVNRPVSLKRRSSHTLKRSSRCWRWKPSLKPLSVKLDLV